MLHYLAGERDAGVRSGEGLENLEMILRAAHVALSLEPGPDTDATAALLVALEALR